MSPDAVRKPRRFVLSLAHVQRSVADLAARGPAFVTLQKWRQRFQDGEQLLPNLIAADGREATHPFGLAFYEHASGAIGLVAKDAVTGSYGFPQARKIPGAEYRYARGANRGGQMHNPRVVAEIGVALCKDGRGAGNR